MKLPFLRIPQEWRARPRIGLDRRVSRVEREMLDAVDIIEQKADMGLLRGTIALNAVLVCLGIQLVFHGRALVALAQKMSLGKILDLLQ